MPTRHIKTQTGQPARNVAGDVSSPASSSSCVLVVDALVGDQGLMATIRARKQYDELAADLARLKAENAGLREDARRLREDPAAIEELARRELGLMSPGEKLFIIKDIDPPASK
jgi:cell division protein FtsB